MSTIKSSDEHLILNADGSNKSVKFQANGVEKASISSSGAFTSTTIDATKLTGTIPNFTSTGIDDNADATAITIDSSENVGIGNTTPKSWDASATALQLGTEAALVDYSGQTWLAQNYYFDGAHKYITTDEASRYRQYGGNHSFEVAASGSADAAISWTNALEITNDGRGLSQFTAKGWVNFDGSGTLSVKDSHNVSSVTDSSNGHYEINWSNNMANGNYSVSATSGHAESENQTDSYTITSFRGTGIKTNKVEIQCIRARFDLQSMSDPKIVCLVAFGD